MLSRFRDMPVVVIEKIIELNDADHDYVTDASGNIVTDASGEGIWGAE